MALRYDDELRARLERLTDELAPLASACVLSFRGEPALVTRALEGVAKEKRWAYSDLRTSDGARARDQLSKVLNAQVVVLAVRPDALRLPVAAVIGAAVDKRATVDLGYLNERSRPTGQSVFLLVEDCPPFAEAPRELQRVPYWDVIP